MRTLFENAGGVIFINGVLREPTAKALCEYTPQDKVLSSRKTINVCQTLIGFGTKLFWATIQTQFKQITPISRLIQTKQELI